MTKSRLISTSLETYYNEASEENRLSTGLGPLEFKRNKTLIGQYISKANSTVLDIGGGTGKYAKWLANQGHTVHLVDPIKKHVKRAEKRAKKLSNPFTCSVGEAQSLDFEIEFADAIILHGPLYHLTQKEERANALNEAYRVLKPGGILLGFAINYTASTLVGLFQGLIHDAEYFDMCAAELTRGDHRPPAKFPFLLPEAHYHRPDALKEEIESANFETLQIHAVEGVAWMDSNFFANMGDKSKHETLHRLIELTERDEHMLSFSPHMMIAGRKPL